MIARKRPRGSSTGGSTLARVVVHRANDETRPPPRSARRRGRRHIHLDGPILAVLLLLLVRSAQPFETRSLSLPPSFAGIGRTATRSTSSSRIRRRRRSISCYRDTYMYNDSCKARRWRDRPSSALSFSHTSNIHRTLRSSRFCIAMTRSPSSSPDEVDAADVDRPSRGANGVDAVDAPSRGENGEHDDDGGAIVEAARRENGNGAAVVVAAAAAPGRPLSASGIERRDGGRRGRRRRVLAKEYEYYFATLRRRLDTVEDKFDVHKLSSLAYLASVVVILFTGATSDWYGSIPPSLQPATWTFVLSSFVQGITSISMSLKYRRNDPIVQKGFVNMAFNMMSLGWALLISSPFVPPFITERCSLVVMLWTLVPIFALTSLELATVPACLAHRAKRRNERGGDLGPMGDAASYGLTIVAGFAASLLGIVVLADPAHDRAWLGATFGTPASTHSYYVSVVTSFSVACGALAITLRDRKVIGKGVEQVMIAVPTVTFVLVQCRMLGVLW